MHLYPFYFLKKNWHNTQDNQWIYCFIVVLEDNHETNFHFIFVWTIEWNIIQWNLIITRTLGPWRLPTLLYQVSHYIRVKRQRNIKYLDQQNYLVIRGFCYIRPLYNEVPLYIKMTKFCSTESPISSLCALDSFIMSSKLYDFTFCTSNRNCHFLTMAINTICSTKHNEWNLPLTYIFTLHLQFKIQILFQKLVFMLVYLTNYQ